ncbi:MAG: threonine/serine exporter family protein [Defluviitaleaceae bacterium]|nr:threonine/serine exporter family protein [Defluviitaleaceae bacterium]
MQEDNAIKLAVMAGEVMLASGAETARVEDTMIRLMESCGYKYAESFCTTTGIFASGFTPDGEQVSMIRRLRSRENNFEKIAKVNDLSRNVADGKINVVDAIRELEKISAIKPYPFVVRLFGSSVSSFCFAYMFGGTIFDALAAFCAVFLMKFVVVFLERHKIVTVLCTISGSMVAAVLSLILVNFAFGSNIEYVIVGAIMPLLPGVALTNAIRDVLDGNMLAGSARTLEALLTAIAIAAGVGTVFALWMSVFGGLV